MGSIYMNRDTYDGKYFVFSVRKSQPDIWMIENFDPEIK